MPTASSQAPTSAGDCNWSCTPLASTQMVFIRRTAAGSSGSAQWHDGQGPCWRSYGNELWEFASNGLMRRREASINALHAARANLVEHASKQPRWR
jgi:Protein of unknown function (DUF1348)